MIAHPLRRSRATSDQINLLHTAFFFSVLFFKSKPLRAPPCFFNTNHLSSPYLFFRRGEGARPGCPSPESPPYLCGSAGAS